MTPGTAPRARRFRPRHAARPVSVYDDPNRRATMSQIASELVDLAGRVIDELLAEACNAALTLEERRGLVAIAVEVDRQAAARTGTMPRTVEIAVRGRVAMAGEVRLGTEGAT